MRSESQRRIENEVLARHTRQEDTASGAPRQEARDRFIDALHRTGASAEVIAVAESLPPYKPCPVCAHEFTSEFMPIHKMEHEGEQ